MTGETVVTRTDQDGVAIIELNRPERKNALIGPMFDQLADHISAASADESVGAIMFGGAGGAFCSGLDLKEYNADPAPEWMATSAASSMRAHLALATCPAPIVVALERYAINGGAAYAFAGDLIVAGESAWLQVGEVQQGMAAPMNLAWLLARYPPHLVTRIVVPGERLDGPTLQQLGVVHEVVPDDEVRTRAIALATQLASYPDNAARAMKTAVVNMASDETGARSDPEKWFARAQQIGGAAARRRPQKQGDASQ